MEIWKVDVLKIFTFFFGDGVLAAGELLIKCQHLPFGEGVGVLFAKGRLMDTSLLSVSNFLKSSNCSLVRSV